MPWVKQFDRAAALEKAEGVFWKNGYDHTSMETLLEGMGIRKGSFYATFGSKHGVLLESLDRYERRRSADFRTLKDAGAPLTAIRHHLDAVLEESTGAHRALGCLLVNSALELGPRDPSVRKAAASAWQAHTAFLQEMLDGAKQRGELPANYDSAARAGALLGVVLGMRVMARGGAPARMIEALRQEAETLLR